MDLSREQRFARAKALANDVPPPRPPPALLAVAVGAAAMIVYGIVVVLRWLDTPELLVYFISWLFTWFVIFGTAGRRALSRLSGALDRTVVIVVDKFLRTVHDEHHYVLVVENEHGDRSEHIVPRRVFTATYAYEIGILFSKRGEIWGFHAVSAT